MPYTNYPHGVTSFGIPLFGGPAGAPIPFNKALFVDSRVGYDARGRNDVTRDKPLASLGRALELVQSYDVIYVAGDFREEGLETPNTVQDVSIVGCGTNPHHPHIGTIKGGATLRPPASPTVATPLLTVRGQGWKFVNLLIDCPVDEAGIVLSRNAASGDDEVDSSHAQFFNCRFDSGLIGIKNAGGASFVQVKGCRFFRMTGSGAAGIKCTSTAVAVPLNWEIEGCVFMDNASHVLSSMSYSAILRNVFGRFTGTLSVDVQNNSAQGEYNVITGNYLSGTYDSTAYPPGSNNEWGGNYGVAGITSADPS